MRERFTPRVLLVWLMLLSACGSTSWAELSETTPAGGTQPTRSLTGESAAPDLRDDNGRTPLHVAVREKRVEMVSLLLRAGANPNSLDQNGEPPLVRAVHDRQLEIVRLLLTSGADPALRNQNGEATIIEAVHDKENAIVELLLSHGADPNSRDQNGRPVLNRAVRDREVAITKLLLGYGAKPNLRDENGETALSEAVARDQPELVELLLAPRLTRPAQALPTPPRAPAAVSGPNAGRLYSRRVAVVIGINDYEKWPALEGATSDARRVSQAFRRLGFDEVIEIYDRDATRVKLLTVLGHELAQRTDSRSLAMIYFAGHGQTETLPNGQKRGYIIPADGDREGVYATAISMSRLRDLSNRLPARQVYYAMDSCYSGLGFVRGISLRREGDGFLQKISAMRSVQMITAGMDGEVAIEVGGQGLFTTYFLRALDGEADFDSDGYVTASEIGTFVRPQVSAASRNRQTPQFGTLEGQGEVVFELSGGGR